MRNVYKSLLVFQIILGITVSVIAQSKFEKKGDRQAADFSFLAATESYLKALEDNNDSDLLKLKLARCYHKLNDPQRSVNWYKQVIINNNLIEPSDRYHYAMALLSTDKIVEAEKWFKSYHKAVPEDKRPGSYIAQIEGSKLLYQDSSLHQIKKVSFNSATADFSPTFYESGVVFVSGRTPGKDVYSWNESAFLDLYYSKRNSFGIFEKPVPFHSEVNSPYHEGPVCFYSNDQKMVFTRNNLLKGKPGKSESGVTKLKLYFTKVDAKKGWAEVEEFAYNSDEYSVGHPSVTQDGSQMYFISDMSGGYGGTDIYVSKFTNGNWNKPENLGSDVNTEGNEMFPYFHANNKLYFSSNGHGGLGGLDIFEYDLQKLSVKNMGYPINSSKDDFGYIVNNEKEGFFSSNRHSVNGEDNIFEFKSIKSLFVQVMVLVVKADNNQPIPRATITANQLNADSSQIFYSGEDGYSTLALELNQKYELSISKDGFSEGHRDITPSKQSEKLLVKLSGNCIPVRGVARLKDLENTEETIHVLLEDDDGNIKDAVKVKNNASFEFCVAPRSVYHVKAMKENYFTKSEPIIVGIDEKIDAGEIVLDKIEINKAITLDNIYYDLGKSEIRSDAAKELNKLVALLEDNPSIEIELSSHTDSRGSDVFNLNLSGKRAKSAAEYIVSQGIDSSRIQSKGYGETQLINNCSNGIQCSTDQHQANRRTEFKVLSY